jgi:hypothetical protein
MNAPTVYAKWDGRCVLCNNRIRQGSRITREPLTGDWMHPRCASKVADQLIARMRARRERLAAQRQANSTQ